MDNSLRIDDAFNDCIDRMARGATIDACVALYPQFEDELRAMLEAGRLVARSVYSSAETAAAQAHVRFLVAGAVASKFGPPRELRRAFAPHPLLSTAAVMGVFFAVAITAFLLLSRGSDGLVPGASPPDVPPESETLIPGETDEPTFTPSPTPSITPTPSQTHTSTPTPSVTPSVTPSRTPSPPTSTSAPSVTPSVTPSRTPSPPTQTPKPTLPVVIPTDPPPRVPADDHDDSDDSSGDEPDDPDH